MRCGVVGRRVAHASTRKGLKSELALNALWKGVDTDHRHLSKSDR